MYLFEFVLMSLLLRLGTSSTFNCHFHACEHVYPSKSCINGTLNTIAFCTKVIPTCTLIDRSFLDKLC